MNPSLNFPFLTSPSPRRRLVGHTDFLYQGWKNAVHWLAQIAKLAPGWDGAKGKVPTSEKVISALVFCRLLAKKTWFAPDRVYPLPDGNIMLEWQGQSEVWRFEIEEPGSGELMITYSDGRRPEFAMYTWRRVDYLNFDLRISQAETTTNTKKIVRKGRTTEDRYPLAA